MMTYLLLLASVLLGALVVLILKPSKKTVRLLLAFSGAYLLSVAILHLLPEVYNGSSDNNIMGICIFKVWRILEGPNTKSSTRICSLWNYDWNRFTAFAGSSQQRGCKDRCSNCACSSEHCHCCSQWLVLWKTRTHKASLDSDELNSSRWDISNNLMIKV